jgi:hypothetical protein
MFKFMKKLALVITFLLLAIKSDAQVQMGLGVPENIFVANASAAPQTGTVYSIPSAGNLITWVVTYATAPASVTTILEFSNDNSTWATGDTSTAVAGETRTLFTAAKFVRATESARSGGGAITLTITAKGTAVAAINSTTSGSVTLGNGQFIAPAGTALLPSYSFSGSTATGLYLFGSNLPGMSIAGTVRSAWGASYFLDSTYPLAWTVGSIGSVADTGISRFGAGVVAVGNGTAGDITGTLRGASIILTGEALAGTNFLAPATGAFYWSGKSIIKSPTDGIVTFTNQASTGFTRLILGTNDATTNGVSLAPQGNGSLSLFTGDGSSAFRPLNILSLNLQTGGKIATYNGVTTAGWGVPSIVASGRVTAQTAAVASITTYTVGAADGTFEVSGNVLVTTSTTHAFQLQVTFTDETNVVRTLAIGMMNANAGFTVSVSNTNGTGSYAGISEQIRCKAATTITILTQAAGTYTTVTYNAEGLIKQVS